MTSIGEALNRSLIALDFMKHGAPPAAVFYKPTVAGEALLVVLKACGAVFRPQMQVRLNDSQRAKRRAVAPADF